MTRILSPQENAMLNAFRSIKSYKVRLAIQRLIRGISEEFKQ